MRVHRPSGVPCLQVGDVGKAVDYYRTFFGFAPVTVSGQAALLHGHGVFLALRAGPRAEDPPVPDAVILVAQPEILRRRLDDRGAHLVGPGTARPDCSYGFRDCYGNVIAVGPAGGVSALRRRIAEPLDTARRALDRSRTARAEHRGLLAFREFLRARPRTSGAYFLHFTEGLLHWAGKTAGLVPGDVPLVLLGSALPSAERAWVRENLGRPFHHIDLRMDDAGVLEFLFAAAGDDFGWLEPGCLVLNPGLFAELSALGRDTSVACAWSWDSGAGFPIANTHLAFFSAGTIAEVRDAGIDVGPGVYARERFNRQVEGRRCYSRTPSRALRELAGPAVPGGMAFYEPTVLYQLAARTLGKRISQVRELSGYGTPQGATAGDESSDELMYIAGLGHADVLEEFSGYFHDAEVRLRYLLAEYLALAPVAATLPDWYGRRLAAVTETLAAQGIAEESVADLCTRHLVEERGLSPHAAALAVGRQEPAGGPG
ncbi:VOC family protein [Amycolatopsis rubida]|uniref:VOC domain-containing protein n=1 Tax=Amycolatopsis rubida TaxID=112413 RepID=A0A1I6AJH3_9PSEU|nr:VOC family protein [Amycolatopsis rubida]SFQ68815.1 hypothetical protein SAMN05421854_11981 [Amycolatopsis rubida]